MEQEERRRIQHKQQASWDVSAWREWTMRLFPKRLEGDQLLSEIVVAEILSIGVRGLFEEWREAVSPKASLRRRAFTHTAGTCKGVEQEERRRIQHKQPASWNVSAWREWTMRLLPKRLEEDQLLSEIVVTQILPIGVWGLWRVKGAHVSQSIVAESGVYAHGRDLQRRGARGEKTHPAQAASFPEFLNMKGVNSGIAPKATWRRPAAFSWLAVKVSTFVPFLVCLVFFIIFFTVSPAFPFWLLSCQCSLFLNKHPFVPPSARCLPCRVPAAWCWWTKVGFQKIGRKEDFENQVQCYFETGRCRVAGKPLVVIHVGMHLALWTH